MPNLGQKVSILAKKQWFLIKKWSNFTSISNMVLEYWYHSWLQISKSTSKNDQNMSKIDWKTHIFYIMFLNHDFDIYLLTVLWFGMKMMSKSDQIHIKNTLKNDHFYVTFWMTFQGVVTNHNVLWR